MLHCPPLCRCHRLGVRDHSGLGEDSLTLLVPGQLEPRLGDIIRDGPTFLRSAFSSESMPSAPSFDRIFVSYILNSYILPAVGQAPVEYVGIPTYSIFS